MLESMTSMITGLAQALLKWSDVDNSNEVWLCYTIYNTVSSLSSEARKDRPFKPTMFRSMTSLHHLIMFS